MKHSRPLKMTVLAAAIGLAIGGTAVAGDKAGHEYDQPTSTMDTAQQRATEKMTTEDSYRADNAQYRDSTTAGKTGKLIDQGTADRYELSEFAAAVDKAGLTDALSKGGEYTVFAPTDEAFREFKDDKGDVSVDQLRDILRAHVVVGSVDASQARTLDSARVLTGDTVKIRKDGDTLEIGDADVVSADIKSGNLTIHTIDAVLDPEDKSQWQAMQSEADQANWDNEPDEEEAE